MSEYYINPKNNEVVKLVAEEVREFPGWVPAAEYVASLTGECDELRAALRNLAEAYENRMGDWENATFYDEYNEAAALLAKAETAGRP